MSLIRIMTHITPVILGKLRLGWGGSQFQSSLGKKKMCETPFNGKKLSVIVPVIPAMVGKN
jgi:hypothetical protein